MFLLLRGGLDHIKLKIFFFKIQFSNRGRGFVTISSRGGNIHRGILPRINNVGKRPRVRLRIRININQGLFFLIGIFICDFLPRSQWVAMTVNS